MRTPTASPRTRRRTSHRSWWAEFRARPTWKLDLALGTIGALMVLIVAVAAMLLWRWWTSPLDTPPTPHAAQPKAQAGLPIDPTALAALPTAMPNAPLPPQPWDGHSRVNLLLMGVDTRVWDSNWGAPRADTLILLTLEPATQTGGMLSIPRDLFVEIPGFGYGKINTAYAIGQGNFGEWGGATLTVHTVERLLRVSIPYFAVVDFRSFVLLVDAMGGVKVDIPETIVVDIQTAQGYKSIRLNPGRQTINGQMALAYARSRAKPVNGLDGDFGRMYRQRLILMGMLNRLKEPWAWKRLTAQAPFLYHELTQSLKTNVRPQDAVAWARIVANMRQDHITTLTIGHGQTTAAFYNGMYILRPDIEAISALRDQLFAPPYPTP
ncbi:MAG TPA: LytR family transcriptional regulator, partial [Anaerolineaceae bacterium]|nr:LytR family transcriptional regulator [Anaerolineaceae bacterium]